ncbi:MAG: DNA/RNA-binding domain of Phe-tRNA-synthetase-like protein, partial [Saprospiraceae bacterium]
MLEPLILIEKMKISIASEFQQKCPGLKLGVLLVKIKTNTEYPELLKLIAAETARVSASMVIEDISKLPAIAAARKGYKAVGKDPARYR